MARSCTLRGAVSRLDRDRFRRFSTAWGDEERIDEEEELLLKPVDKNAKENAYCLKKQRIHAMLWLDELRKARQPNAEAFHEKFQRTYCNEDEEHPGVEVGPDEWEGKSEDALVRRRQAADEEKAVVDEFERRMDFNRKQLYSFVKAHIMSRRRPIDGWSYMVEELGLETRARVGGGIRIAEPCSNKSPRSVTYEHASADSSRSPRSMW